MAVRYSGGHRPEGTGRCSHFSVSSVPDIPPETASPPQRTDTRRSDNLGSLLGALSGRLADRDTLLTAVLLLLLLREGGDRRLILALAYILM